MTPRPRLTVNKTALAARKVKDIAAYDRARKLTMSYGLTVAQYDALLRRQDGRCAICRRPPKIRRLSVDHDHKTKRVRGLTCHQCNRHLIAKNTVATARLLILYLSDPFDGRSL